MIGLGVVGYMGGGDAAPGVAENQSSVDQTDDATPAGEAKNTRMSLTALIPAFFGSALSLCGVLALDESKLKHAMHVVAMLAVL